MSFWTLRSLKNSATWTSGGMMKPHQRPGYLLVKRIYDPNHLPVPAMRSHRLRRSLAKCRDVEIVSEFRSKMRAAEEMMSKLAFSLKEIQGMRKMSKPEKLTHTSNGRSKVSRLNQIARPLVLVSRSEA